MRFGIYDFRIIEAKSRFLTLPPNSTSPARMNPFGRGQEGTKPQNAQRKKQKYLGTDLHRLTQIRNREEVSNHARLAAEDK